MTGRASALGAARREAFFSTPYGTGRLVLSGDQPVELEIPDPSRRPAAGAALDAERWCGLLSRYFSGERVAFPLDLEAYVDSSVAPRSRPTFCAPWLASPTGAR